MLEQESFPAIREPRMLAESLGDLPSPLLGGCPALIATPSRDPRQPRLAFPGRAAENPPNARHPCVKQKTSPRRICFYVMRETRTQSPSPSTVFITRQQGPEGGARF